jgi:hypothetical protein
MANRYGTILVAEDGATFPAIIARAPGESRDSLPGLRPHLTGEVMRRS